MNARKIIGCYFIGAVIGFIIAIIYYNSSSIKIERQKPTMIGYRELIEKTDKYSVYRDCKYELVNIIYDTIPNRKLSAIETPVIQKTPPVVKEDRCYCKSK